MTWLFFLLGKSVSEIESGLSSKLDRLERLSYDLEMKMREQNKNNKRTEIKRFDWCTERIQTHLAFGWLSEGSAKKTSYPKNFLEIVHF